MIKLFVGLGNPGPEYETTRHNAGFWWLEALAGKLGARLVPERGWQALAARVNRPEGPVWLLEPMTFMNRSGFSVATLARFYKIEPQQILVVHDELDLLPGQAKLKFGGSAAGHNGLKDIHGMLGTQDFWRLRLGIGHPGVKAEVVNYVLKRPSAADRDAIVQAIDKTLDASDLLMAGEMDKALARIHAQPPRPKPPRPAAPASDRAGTGAGEAMKFALPLSLTLPWLVAASCAVAQPVWRCGADQRSFSDRPCADGRPLQMAALADLRSPAQQEQARQVAAREQRLADSLRQQRLAREQLGAVPSLRRQPPDRRAAPKRAADELSAAPAALAPAPSRRATAPRLAPAAAGTSPSAARASRRDRG